MHTLGVGLVVEAQQHRGEVWRKPLAFPLPAVWTGVSAGRAGLSLARRDTHCICVHTASPAGSEQTPWADCLSSFSCLRPLKRTGPGGYPCCLHPQSHCQKLQQGLQKDKAHVTDFYQQGYHLRARLLTPFHVPVLLGVKFSV